MSTLRSPITTEQIILGYCQGLFPMARGRFGKIDWFMAEPRTIIPLDDRFKIPRTLRRILARSDYRIGFDEKFDEVIRACSRHDQVIPEEVWLSNQMIDLYSELHRRGYAHSVELYDGAELVGGLYGVAIGGAFFGESMFSRVSSASQIALVGLVERLRSRRFLLLDAQMRTPHISRFGAIDLSHDEYVVLLASAVGVERQFG